MKKVILYMAISANGYIAKDDNDVSFISKESWKGYAEKIKNAGNVILGRTTYEAITNQEGSTELDGLKAVVVSHGEVRIKDSNHFLAHSPKQALELLSDFDEVIVAGGGGANASFIEENLIDEIYLDIEPVVFGKGVPLFAFAQFEKKLKLLETKKLSENEIQLHYQVIK